MNNGHARKLTFTDAQIAEMERLYLDGYSTKAIGDRFGCLMGSVWRRLRDRGVALRKFNERGAQSCARPRRAVHGYVVIGHRYAHRLIAETMLGAPCGEANTSTTRTVTRRTTAPRTLRY